MKKILFYYYNFFYLRFYTIIYFFKLFYFRMSNKDNGLYSTGN